MTSHWSNRDDPKRSRTGFFSLDFLFVFRCFFSLLFFFLPREVKESSTFVTKADRCRQRELEIDATVGLLSRNNPVARRLLWVCECVGVWVCVCGGGRKSNAFWMIRLDRVDLSEVDRIGSDRFFIHLWSTEPFCCCCRCRRLKKKQQQKNIHFLADGFLFFNLIRLYLVDFFLCVMFFFLRLVSCALRWSDILYRFKLVEGGGATRGRGHDVWRWGRGKGGV